MRPHGVAHNQIDRGAKPLTMNAIVLVALRRPYTFIVMAILIVLYGVLAIQIGRAHV